MGVWIETDSRCSYGKTDSVTPCVGVWIETCHQEGDDTFPESHPAWVCGLKLRWALLLLWIRVTPCVGVWIETFITNKYTGARIVTPCVGVWIETRALPQAFTQMTVTPCVGVWIETQYGSVAALPALSHPAWVCGLKRGKRRSLCAD